MIVRQAGLAQNVLDLLAPSTALVRMDSGPVVLDQLAAAGANFLARLVLALLIVVAAGWAAKIVLILISRAGRSISAGDSSRATFQSFFGSFAQYSVLGLGIVWALQVVGVQSATLLAIVGAATLAISLALQSTLSQVASGVFILIFRPYKVGEIIETQGRIGRVTALDLTSTHLTTFDNLRVVLPNSKVFGDTIVNFSRGSERRVDCLLRLPPFIELGPVLRSVDACVRRDPRVLSEPDVVVEVSAVTELYVEIIARVWVKGPDFAQAKVDLMKAIRLDIEPVLLGFSKIQAQVPKP
jgi:small conductance mechanosensitive channel